VDVNIDVALNEEVIDSLDVLVLASVGRAENGTDADGVLIAEIDALLGVDYVAFGGAVDVLLLDVEVAARFLWIVSVRSEVNEVALTSQQTCTAEFMTMLGLS
jgi:hypothetical protein